MIDVASGGALVDKTPEEARRLIAKMAANSQQFGMRMDHRPNKVNEVSTSNLKKQISDLTSLVRQICKLLRYVEFVRVRVMLLTCVLRYKRMNQCNMLMQ